MKNNKNRHTAFSMYDTPLLLCVIFCDTPLLLCVRGLKNGFSDNRHTAFTMSYICHLSLLISLISYLNPQGKMSMKEGKR